MLEYNTTNKVFNTLMKKYLLEMEYAPGRWFGFELHDTKKEPLTEILGIGGVKHVCLKEKATGKTLWEVGKCSV